MPKNNLSIYLVKKEYAEFNNIVTSDAIPYLVQEYLDKDLN